MNYYYNASKIIYRRYRILRKIIQTFEYTNLSEFRNAITILIGAVYDSMNTFYGVYPCLFYLNTYYKTMCFEAMYVRIDIESIKGGFKMSNKRKRQLERRVRIEFKQFEYIFTTKKDMNSLHKFS